MINAGDYAVPGWIEREEQDPIEALLESLGEFISDGLEDTAQTGKALLQSPLMLHNIMLANIMLVGLIQRQNDMVNDSQEASNNDLFTLASVGNVASIISEPFEQAMVMRQFTISNGATAGAVLTLSISGPHTIGQLIPLFATRLVASGIAQVQNIAQIIPAGSQLTLGVSTNNNIILNADIRPLVRYKDSIYRSQRNITGF